ncbi:MAG: hypothetical protein M1827_005451 [Pycnora praestabilis]|nr:MAG: hypothetical protein M1827_005451 [Pycnora praestabilis]
MTPNGVGVEDYRVQLDKFRSLDSERNGLLENTTKELVVKCKDLQEKWQRTQNDYQWEYKGRNSLQQELQQLHKLRDRGLFVLVLIDADADGYIFQERFLRNGANGGREAADELLGKVKEYLATFLDGYDDKTNVVVRAYANLKDLAYACVKKQLLPSAIVFENFVSGFTQRQALFDFVDVGAGKERADHKIRENLRMSLANWQCKHVVLGCCHDAGYAPFLEQFAANDADAERITLLEGTPVASKISALGFKRTVRMPSVFVASPLSVGSPALPSHSSIRWARPNRLGPIKRNNKGERVDERLDIDSSIMSMLRKRMIQELA